MTGLRCKSYKITHGLAEAREKVVGNKVASEETSLQVLIGKPRGPN